MGDIVDEDSECRMVRYHFAERGLIIELNQASEIVEGLADDSGHDFRRCIHRGELRIFWHQGEVEEYEDAVAGCHCLGISGNFGCEGAIFGKPTDLSIHMLYFVDGKS